jgi:cysteine-rich repeat protein
MHDRSYFPLLLSASFLIACPGDDVTDDEIGDTGTDTTTDTGDTEEESTSEDTETETDVDSDTTDTTEGTTDTTEDTTEDTTDTTDGSAVCGDGNVEMAEECDDGNVDDGDGCSSTCTLECGDGTVQGTEECDDGNMDGSDDCTSACTLATCGDGFVWADNEECDDGNDDDHDDCLTGCVAASCGDGLIAAGTETCDEGDPDDGSGCSSTCEVELYSRCVGEGPDSCNPIRILYAPADVDTLNYRMAIATVTGGVVDYFDARSGTPTAMTLQDGYDCVFTHGNQAYSNSMMFGTVLRDHVDAGGNVVLGIKSGLAGTPIMAVGYSPVTAPVNTSNGAVNYTGDGVTVIHTNVENYGLIKFDHGMVLQGGGMSDGTYNDGWMATAYRPDFKVVYINGTGGSWVTPLGQSWGRLTANACAAGYFVQP